MEGVGSDGFSVGIVVVSGCRKLTSDPDVNRDILLSSAICTHEVIDAKHHLPGRPMRLMLWVGRRPPFGLVILRIAPPTPQHCHRFGSLQIECCVYLRRGW